MEEDKHTGTSIGSGRGVEEDTPSCTLETFMKADGIMSQVIMQVICYQGASQPASYKVCADMEDMHEDADKSHRNSRQNTANSGASEGQDIPEAMNADKEKHQMATEFYPNNNMNEDESDRDPRQSNESDNCDQIITREMR